MRVQYAQYDFGSTFYSSVFSDFHGKLVGVVFRLSHILIQIDALGGMTMFHAFFDPALALFSYLPTKVVQRGYVISEPSLL